MLDTLDTLPSHVLLHLCMYLGGQDLAALEAVARHFRQPLDASGGAVAEYAAEQKVLGHKDVWRIVRRVEESWKFLLSVLEGGLAASALGGGGWRSPHASTGGGGTGVCLWV